jgi:hypothetical protein
MIEDFPTLEESTVESVTTQVRLEEDEFDARSITYIEGSDWGVEYYAQSTTSNDTLNLPDVSLPETEQQYIKYNIPLKVTSPIQGDVPSDISGTAIVWLFKPNVFDVFRTKILGGVTAIFKVDTVTRKSMYLRDIYEITYSLLTTVNSDPELSLMLDGRTIDSYTYNTNTNYSVSKPLLKTNDLIEYESVSNYYTSIREDFKRSFHSKMDMLTVVVNDEVYLDPIINSLYFYIIGDVCNQFSFDINVYGSVLPGVLVSRNTTLLNSLMQPMYGKYTYGDTSEDLYRLRLRNHLLYDIDYIISEDGDIVLENSSDSLPREDVYLMNDLTGENLTVIESLTYEYLNDRPVNKELLLPLAKEYFTFTDIEKYKYGVVILMLLKYTLSKE